MSSITARAGAASFACLNPSSDRSLMVRWSSSDTIGNPAAIIATPTSSINLAISIFSSTVSRVPAVCSPSRNVSSHTHTRGGIDGDRNSSLRLWLTINPADSNSLVTLNSLALLSTNSASSPHPLSFLKHKKTCQDGISSCEWFLSKTH